MYSCSFLCPEKIKMGLLVSLLYFTIWKLQGVRKLTTGDVPRSSAAVGKGAGRETAASRDTRPCMCITCVEKCGSVSWSRRTGLCWTSWRNLIVKFLRNSGIGNSCSYLLCLSLCIWVFSVVGSVASWSECKLEDSKMLSSYKAKIKMQSSVMEPVSIEGKVVEVLWGITVEERWSVPIHSSHVRHKIQLQR